MSTAALHAESEAANALELLLPNRIPGTRGEKHPAFCKEGQESLTCIELLLEVHIGHAIARVKPGSHTTGLLLPMLMESQHDEERDHVRHKITQRIQCRRPSTHPHNCF